MSMHLLGPWYTTTNTKKRGKKSNTSKALVSKHDQWLLKNGVHPEQIKLKKSVDKNWKTDYNESMKVDRSGYVSAGLSGSKSACAKRGVMANLHKEKPEVREAILEKASRVMPLYNKGGLQLLSPSDDLTKIGTLSRRG